MYWQPLAVWMSDGLDDEQALFFSQEGGRHDEHLLSFSSELTTLHHCCRFQIEIDHFLFHLQAATHISS